MTDPQRDLWALERDPGNRKWFAANPSAILCSPTHEPAQIEEILWTREKTWFSSLCCRLGRTPEFWAVRSRERQMGMCMGWRQ